MRSSALQPEAPPARPVGAGELLPGQRDARPADRLGRERQGLRPHEPKSGQLGVDSVREVEGGARTEAACADAEAGEADDVHRPPAERLPEGHAEAAARVDCTAPPVREPDSLQLREGGEEVPGQHLEGLRPLVEMRPQAVAEVVDGVVAAPEDAVVARQPVVMELVAGVGGALAVLPTHRRRAAPRKAAPSRARSRRQARRSGGSSGRAAGTPRSRAPRVARGPAHPGCAARRPHRPPRCRGPVSPRRPGLRATPPRPRAPMPDGPGRARRRLSSARPRRGTWASRSPRGRPRRRATPPRTRSAAAPSHAPRGRPPRARGSRRRGRRRARNARRSRASSIAATMPARLSRPSSSRRSISSGKRESPFASPCVSDESQKPPFRPLAPNAIRSPSRRTTERSGSARSASTAAQSPVSPPPTMARSQSISSSSGSRAGGRSAVASQKGSCSASASAV